MDLAFMPLGPNDNSPKSLFSGCLSYQLLEYHFHINKYTTELKWLGKVVPFGPKHRSHITELGVSLCHNVVSLVFVSKYLSTPIPCADNELWVSASYTAEMKQDKAGFNPANNRQAEQRDQSQRDSMVAHPQMDEGGKKMKKVPGKGWQKKFETSFKELLVTRVASLWFRRRRRRRLPSCSCSRLRWPC